MIIADLFICEECLSLFVFVCQCIVAQPRKGNLKEEAKSLSQ